MSTVRQAAADLKYARIAKSFGIKNSLRTAWEARAAGISPSLAFALVEQESGNGRNVFGHDPTSSIPSSWKGTVVTRAKYLHYKANRKQGLGMQGVGPLQLTWFATQDEADKAGGCHIPKYNLRTGFRTLRALIRTWGTWGSNGGVRRYNGSGPAAQGYWREVKEKQEKWHKRLHGR